MVERIDNVVQCIEHSLVGSIDSSLDAVVCSLVGNGSLGVFLELGNLILKSLELCIHISESCNSLGGSLFLDIV